jgi:hypothetical protein
VSASTADRFIRPPGPGMYHLARDLLRITAGDVNYLAAGLHRAWSYGMEVSQGGASHEGVLYGPVGGFCVSGALKNAYAAIPH